MMKTDIEIKLEGHWCDFCGKKHADNCKKI